MTKPQTPTPMNGPGSTSPTTPAATDRPLVRGLLGTLLARVYAAAATHRNRRFDNGHRVVTLDRPVISVGNLSLGGTGKTPMVQRIVAHLRDHGHDPAIAMRGYASKHAGLSDEAELYKSTFDDLPIVAQPRRLEGLFQLFATERGRRVDCVVLDDGFQHRFIARQLNLVLIDAAHDPFAARVVPAGRLREPAAGLARATHAAAHPRRVHRHRPRPIPRSPGRRRRGPDRVRHHRPRMDRPHRPHRRPRPPRARLIPRRQARRRRLRHRPPRRVPRRLRARRRSHRRIDHPPRSRPVQPGHRRPHPARRSRHRRHRPHRQGLDQTRPAQHQLARPGLHPHARPALPHRLGPPRRRPAHRRRNAPRVTHPIEPLAQARGLLIIPLPRAPRASEETPRQTPPLPHPRRRRRLHRPRPPVARQLPLRQHRKPERPAHAQDKAHPERDRAGVLHPRLQHLVRAHAQERRDQPPHPRQRHVHPHVLRRPCRGAQSPGAPTSTPAPRRQRPAPAPPPTPSTATACWCTPRSWSRRTRSRRTSCESSGTGSRAPGPAASPRTGSTAASSPAGSNW
ncbi:MAG: hypothetical protein HND58_07150 [Planctomycetota bacterium]|nr:MAG: hypothetical protein HND58_07150 [Planctomycetota bacterium]